MQVARQAITQLRGDSLQVWKKLAHLRGSLKPVRGLVRMIKTEGRMEVSRVRGEEWRGELMFNRKRVSDGLSFLR